VLTTLTISAVSMLTRAERKYEGSVDNSVGIASTPLFRQPRNWGALDPVGTGFILLHNVQTDPVTCESSCTRDTGFFFFWE
jgi:hypothetical protein